MQTITVSELQAHPRDFLRSAGAKDVSIVVDNGTALFLTVPCTGEILPLAMRLFQAGKISLREGAALASLPLEGFMESLAEADIPVVEFDEDDVTNAFKAI